eukprot:8336947-Pyramimonas_sp.AAC.1
MKRDFGNKLTWAKCHGPMSATFLSLSRMGWAMLSAHQVVGDRGSTISFLRAPPMEAKRLLLESIGSWQMKRILAHIPEAFGSEEVWRRGLRLAILRIKDDVRRGCARLLLGSGC